MTQKRSARRVIAALLAVAIALAAVGAGQSQQARGVVAPEVVADPGGNGSGTGG